MSILKQKIKDRSVTLGVVGLGYVGLPLAVEKAKAGFYVIGFDVQEEKVDMVNRGHNYIGDVVNHDLEEIVKSGHLKATMDFAAVASCDCVCIAVPTPLDEHQQPDISYVRSSAESIMPYVHKDMSREARARKVQTSLIEEFRYPKFGPGQLWETVAGDVRDAGGEVLKKCEVTDVEMADGRIAAVRYRENGMPSLIRFPESTKVCRK